MLILGSECNTFLILTNLSTLFHPLKDGFSYFLTFIFYAVINEI